MEAKIAEVATLVAGLDVDVEVDGGIGPTPVAGAVTAGANVARRRQLALPRSRRSRPRVADLR